MSANEPIGFIGLGMMGGAMAGVLLRSGRGVIGCDVNPARTEALEKQGLKVALTPAEVAAQCSIIFVSVVHASQLMNIIDGPGGLLSRAAQGRIIVDTSTISPKSSSEVDSRLRIGGASLLRAAVSGSSEFAATGNISFFCSGRQEDYERVRPLLDILGRSNVYVGEGELARVVKLLINLVLLGTLELLGEALALGEAVGLSRKAALQYVGESAIGSPFIGYKTTSLVAEDYSPTATVGLVRKDLHLVMELGEQVGYALPATHVIDSIYAECEQQGHGDLDCSIVVEILKERRLHKQSH